MNTAVTFMLFKQAGIPKPATEFVFHKDRLWRFDFAWPDMKIALEVEGGVWSGGRHNRGSGFMKDMEKYDEAAVAGWCVIRVTPKSLNSLLTIDLLKRAFAMRKEAA